MPKEYIYKLFADDEDVFLFGMEKKRLLIRFTFSFCEHDEQMELAEQTIFSVDARRDRKRLDQQTNLGDNKLILSSLANDSCGNR